MNLTQIFVTWLIVGLTGVVLDLIDNQKDYKGIPVVNLTLLILFYSLGGAIVFVMALNDFLQYRKQLKRKDEVIEYINYLKRIANELTDIDFAFIWDLKCSARYGVVTDPEFEKLKRIVESYSLVNTLR